LETFRLPVMDKAALAATTESRTEGIEVLDKAYAQGRGVIAVLPHSGNWDVAAVWLIAHGIPFATVAERLRPESLYRLFGAYRESHSSQILPRAGGDLPASDVQAT